MPNLLNPVTMRTFLFLQQFRGKVILTSKDEAILKLYSKVLRDEPTRVIQAAN